MDNNQLYKIFTQKIVIGVDEVGRGSWAGPLVVGAVMLDIKVPILGLKDSKQIVKAQREKLTKQIIGSAKSYALGWVWPLEIDALGLTGATTLAIERALMAMPAHDYIVIDGSVNFLPDNNKAIALIKADSRVPAVSAASIVAKVYRDNYMAQQSLLYPDYGFETHVGYGTPRHKKALISYGATPLHRMSFRPVQKLCTSN